MMSPSQVPPFVLMLLIAMAVQLVMVISPYAFWKFWEGWKYDYAQPSDDYLLMIRVGGIGGLLLAMALMFYTIVCYATG